MYYIVKDKSKLSRLIAYKKGSCKEYCESLGVSQQYYQKAVSSPMTEQAYRKMLAPILTEEQESLLIEKVD